MGLLRFYLKKHLPPTRSSGEGQAALVSHQLQNGVEFCRNLMGLRWDTRSCCASSAGWAAGARPECPHHPQGRQHHCTSSQRSAPWKAREKLGRFGGRKGGLALVKWHVSLADRAREDPKPRAQIAHSSQPKPAELPRDADTPGLTRTAHDTAGREPWFQTREHGRPSQKDHLILSSRQREKQNDLPVTPLLLAALGSASASSPRSKSVCSHSPREGLGVCNLFTPFCSSIALQLRKRYKMLFGAFWDIAFQSWRCTSELGLFACAAEK